MALQLGQMAEEAAITASPVSPRETAGTTAGPQTQGRQQMSKRSQTAIAEAKASGAKAEANAGAAAGGQLPKEFIVTLGLSFDPLH